MGKIKIHEIAKEVGLNSKEVIKIANDLGIGVTSHLSAVDDEQAAKIKENIKVNESKTKKEDESKAPKASKKETTSSNAKKNETPVIIRREVIISEEERKEKEERRESKKNITKKMLDLWKEQIKTITILFIETNKLNLLLSANFLA